MKNAVSLGCTYYVCINQQWKKAMDWKEYFSFVKWMMLEMSKPNEIDIAAGVNLGS